MLEQALAERNKLGNNCAEYWLKSLNSKPGNRMKPKIVKRFELSVDYRQDWDRGVDSSLRSE